MKFLITLSLALVLASPAFAAKPDRNTAPTPEALIAIDANNNEVGPWHLNSSSYVVTEAIDLRLVRVWMSAQTGMPGGAQATYYEDPNCQGTPIIATTIFPTLQGPFFDASLAAASFFGGLEVVEPISAVGAFQIQATLQQGQCSSQIFSIHDGVQIRVLEDLLDTFPAPWAPTLR